jgi:hypothetical protein
MDSFFKVYCPGPEIAGILSDGRRNNRPFFKAFRAGLAISALMFHQQLFFCFLQLGEFFLAGLWIFQAERLERSDNDL